MNIGFNNEKYVKLQSEKIKERIKMFDKLYLEIGGKLFSDNHAERVLPGFVHDSKIKMFQELKDILEIIFCINANDIEKNNATVIEFLKKGGINDGEIIVSAPAVTDRLAQSYIPENSHVRDILCVSGILAMGDTIDILACHLPSKLNGRKASRLRSNVVKHMQQAIDSIITIRTVPRIIVMGDFNDTANSEALLPLTKSGQLICITDTLSGSYRYKGNWQQIDHIYLSPILLDTTQTLHLSSRAAWISDDSSLIEPEPIYGGYRPHRTYNGMRYEGGTSDHLPVCFDLNFVW
jgi:exonuclease III